MDAVRAGEGQRGARRARAATREASVAEPVRQVLSAPGLAVIQPRDEVVLVVLRGASPSARVEELLLVLRALLEESPSPLSILFDLRGLETAEARSLEVYDRFIDQHRALLAHRVRRQALLITPGLVAVACRGYVALAPPPFAWGFFTEPAEALRWLGGEHDVQERELGLLQELSAEPPSLLASLLALFSEAQGVCALQAAARRLALSSRTLQRCLAEAGTSFQRELGRWRLDETRRLLLETDEKVTTIALAVGYGSLQHLNRAFRGQTGRTPTQWRAEARARRPR